MTTKQTLSRKITKNQDLYQIRSFDTLDGAETFNYVDVYIQTADTQRKIYIGSYYIHKQERLDDSMMKTKIQYNRHFVAIVSKINGTEHCVKLYDTAKREIYNLSGAHPFDYKKYLHITKDTFQGIRQNILYQQQQEKYLELLNQKVKTWKLDYKQSK